MGKTTYYSGPFQDNWTGKLVETSIVGKWNIFLNGLLIVSDLALNPNTLAFYMIAGNNDYSFIDMDYLNAWVNIDRIP